MTVDRPCGAEANSAKFLGARDGHDCAWQAIMTHGGFGYAKEYHVERLFREVSIHPACADHRRAHPVLLIAEKVLDLAKELLIRAVHLRVGGHQRLREISSRMISDVPP